MLVMSSGYRAAESTASPERRDNAFSRPSRRSALIQFGSQSKACKQADAPRRPVIISRWPHVNLSIASQPGNSVERNAPLLEHPLRGWQQWARARIRAWII